MLGSRNSNALSISKAGFSTAVSLLESSRCSEHGSCFIKRSCCLLYTSPAVNLRWAVERVLGRARVALDGGAAPAAVADALFAEAKRMEAEDEAANRAIGAHGAALLRQGSRVLTHCNAGSLATAFYGTALGVVYAAAEQGKIERVYADETRPVGQGARLTSWELARAGVPCTLVCDNMAASLMAKGCLLYTSRCV